MKFSLFFFGASSSNFNASDFVDIVKKADRLGFHAVWIPERHFHEFGALFPNPAVMGAALAAATERIHIRAGSVVAPLHSAARIAEEWAVVDALSQGRAGVSFASGWHKRDFLLSERSFDERREYLVEQLELVEALWEGKATPISRGGESVRTFPQPAAGGLPTWITVAGSGATADLASSRGYGVLTHLVGQGVDRLEELIRRYRERFVASRRGTTSNVTLMLHTSASPDRSATVAAARPHLQQYLASALDLSSTSQGDQLPVRVSEEDKTFLIERATERFLADSSVVGDADDVRSAALRFQSIGVDEIACLVDFGPSVADIHATVEVIGSVISGEER